MFTIFLLRIDTHNAWSHQQWTRRWSGEIFGRCIANKYGDIIFLFIHSIYSSSSFNTGTHNADSYRQQNRQGRSTRFSECITNEQGEIAFLFIDLMFTIFISHRHWQHWILSEMTSAMKGQNIWRKHCKWIQYDNVSIYS